jgi:hypothetical protein
LAPVGVWWSHIDSLSGRTRPHPEAPATRHKPQARTGSFPPGTGVSVPGGRFAQEQPKIANDFPQNPLSTHGPSFATAGLPSSGRGTGVAPPVGGDHHGFPPPARQLSPRDHIRARRQPPLHPARFGPDRGDPPDDWRDAPGHAPVPESARPAPVRGTAAPVGWAAATDSRGRCWAPRSPRCRAHRREWFASIRLGTDGTRAVCRKPSLLTCYCGDRPSCEISGLTRYRR